MIDAVDEKIYLNRKILKFSTAVTAGAAAANTTTVFDQGVGSWLTGDIILRIEKPTEQAGLVVAGARVDAAGHLQIQYGNLTAGAITPTAAESYNLIVAR